MCIFILHFVGNNKVPSGKKLHNEELHDPYSSQIEKNEMGGSCSVYGGGKRGTGFWCENLKERDHLVDPGVYRKIILRRILMNWDVGVWTGLSWLRIETGGGHL
jgi:hypothetical protein